MTLPELFDADPTLLGKACALLAPACWAISLTWYARLTLSPASLNLFKNSVAAGLLLLTCLAMGVPFPYERSALDWTKLALSGVIGLAIADTLLLGALQKIGPGRLAIADATYAPWVVVFAWAALGERPGPAFALGGALVVAGVLLAQWRPSEGSAREPGISLAFVLAVLAMAGTAAGVVLSKPVVADGDLLEVTLSRLLFGLVGQAVMITADRGWSDALTGFRDAEARPTLLKATVVGTYLSLVVWLGGFKWAPASTAAVLNQFGTVFLLALGGPMPARQIGGALIAAAGAFWIVAGG